MAATTATERGTVRRRPGGRRAVILAAALELFSRQGYQETGIDEIGAASGVSGPAIYRHFGSKQELLAAAFMDSFDRRRAQIRDRLAGVTVADERLEVIVRDTVENALDERQVLTLYTRELRHLPREMRAPVQRKQQELTNDWVMVLSSVHPHLSPAEARMAVVCVHNLIATLGSTDGGMNRSELERMLVAMSLGALGAAGDDV
ncbi:MAG TPA: TetR/AcrR family transcriptional regulator [Mycobacteriales bacterium]|nr:TetR/AcrR family transcriptional regulator [Mycobacteriales bacterium]